MSSPRSGRAFPLGKVTVLGDLAPAAAATSLAIVASFAHTPATSRSLVELCEQLSANGYEVVVVRATDGEPSIRWSGHAGSPTPVVLMRPNLGYDFGSWSAALDTLGGAKHAERVILANDSMAGPFDSISPLIHHFEQSWAPAWGATSTRQFAPHLQTFFIGFKDGLVHDPSVVRFFRQVEHLEDKFEIVRRYEIGLSALLYSEAVPFDAFAPAEFLAPGGENPTIRHWRRLLELGLPFVKRQLIRSPSFARDGAMIPDVLARTYGIIIDDWLPRDDLAEIENNRELNSGN